MALFDWMAPVANSVGNILEQPGVQNAAIAGLAAIPAAFLARSLTPRASRAGAVGNVANFFGKLALNELMRPREMKEKLLEYQLKSGELTPTPIPGAAPVAYLAGNPVYRQPTLKQTMPGIFATESPKIDYQTTPESIGFAPYNVPQTPTAMVKSQPLSPIMQLLGNIPGTSENQLKLATALLRQKAQQPTVAGLAASLYGNDPAKLDAWLNRQGRSGSQSPLEIGRSFRRGDKWVTPIFNRLTGQTTFAEGDVTQMNWLTQEDIRGQSRIMIQKLLDAEEELARLQSLGASPEDIAEAQRKVNSIENRRRAIFQAERDMQSGYAPPSGDASSYFQDLTR